ncbi:uncharacterized protein LOC118164841 [Oxyura jamaicensis]|uniref:uncharacterized protein LOC118164841 n=1 Tax=Oxyura jamaicensis TaxID=8884 RepID=UPI0015A70AF5|nr:uncharacterized protein LOC118164841 [Oxyura jamaicensis]
MTMNGGVVPPLQVTAIRVVVLSWVLPLRSGCVGILKNNRLRLFASFSNQLQLNAKTSADPMYLSNIHPANGSTRCCSPCFTWKQMLRGGSKGNVADATLDCEAAADTLQHTVLSNTSCIGHKMGCVGFYANCLTTLKQLRRSCSLYPMEDVCTACASCGFTQEAWSSPSLARGAFSAQELILDVSSPAPQPSILCRFSFTGLCSVFLNLL